MDVFIEFIRCIMSVFVQMLNGVFGITVFGLNFGALFVIGLIVSLAAWLIWGE